MNESADIRIVLVAAILLTCAAAVGCHKQTQPSTQTAQDGIVAIGVVGGTDEKAKSEIKATLRALGIEPLPEGFLCGVLVSSKEQAEKAMRILSKDSKRKYTWEFLER